MTNINADVLAINSVRGDEYFTLEKDVRIIADNLIPNLNIWCPFCGGEVEERGGSCNYGKHTITLDIKCGECGTIFKFKSNWKLNPIPEALEAWNRRASNDGGAGA